MYPGWGFPGGSVVKNLPANAGDVSLISDLGRFPGDASGYPRQYSCLGNPMNRGAWWVTVRGVTKSLTCSVTKTTTLWPAAICRKTVDFALLGCRLVFAFLGDQVLGQNLLSLWSVWWGLVLWNQCPRIYPLTAQECINCVFSRGSDNIWAGASLLLPPGCRVTGLTGSSPCSYTWHRPWRDATASVCCIQLDPISFSCFQINKHYSNRSCSRGFCSLLSAILKLKTDGISSQNPKSEPSWKPRAWDHNDVQWTSIDCDKCGECWVWLAGSSACVGAGHM